MALMPQYFTSYSANVPCLHPPTYGLYIIHKEKEKKDVKKPAFRRVGWLEQSHCQPQQHVKYWCNDDSRYFGVVLTELFHVFLL